MITDAAACKAMVATRAALDEAHTFASLAYYAPNSDYGRSESLRKARDEVRRCLDALDIALGSDDLAQTAE